MAGASLPESSENKDCYFSGSNERRVPEAIGHLIQREAPQAVIGAVMKVAPQ